MAAKICAQAKL